MTGAGSGSSSSVAVAGAGISARTCCTASWGSGTFSCRTPGDGTEIAGRNRFSNHPRTSALVLWVAAATSSSTLSGFRCGASRQTSDRLSRPCARSAKSRRCFRATRAAWIRLYAASSERCSLAQAVGVGGLEAQAFVQPLGVDLGEVGYEFCGRSSIGRGKHIGPADDLRRGQMPQVIAIHGKEPPRGRLVSRLRPCSAGVASRPDPRRTRLRLGGPRRCAAGRGTSPEGTRAPRSDAARPSTRERELHGACRIHGGCLGVGTNGVASKWGRQRESRSVRLVDECHQPETRGLAVRQVDVTPKPSSRS